MPLFPGPCRLQLGSDNDRLTGLVSAIEGNTDILIRRILVSLLSADLGPHMLKHHPWMPERRCDWPVPLLPAERSRSLDRFVTWD